VRRRKSTVDKKFTDVSGGQEVGTGVWLSEAALWLEWKNVGIFTAVNDGLFFCLEVESFNNVVKSYTELLPLVIAYSIEFEDALKNQTHLSDILDMELECRLVDERRQSHAGGGSERLGRGLHKQKTKSYL